MSVSPPNEPSARSAAYRQYGPMPGEAGGINMSRTSRTDFSAAHQGETAERRESDMVARDAPRPVLRPSPALAYDVDRESFESRLQQERDTAAQDRAQRMQAFRESRTAESAPVRSHDFNRNAGH